MSGGGVIRHPLPRRPQVVAGFPAVGKSTFAQRYPHTVLDSDSSRFGWVGEGAGKARNPLWPGNYIEHIQAALAAEKLVLVSTHAEVRVALRDAGIEYSIVVPDLSLRVEYLQRMALRGSPLALLQVVDANWDDWLSAISRTPVTVHTLQAGEYLGIEQIGRAEL